MNITRYKNDSFKDCLTANPETVENLQGVLVEGLPDGTEILPAEHGIFLKFHWDKPSARQIIPLGEWSQVERFTACHRYEPFWMKPCAGTQLSDVPVETQSLICDLFDKTCLLCIPIIDGAMRASLQGAGDNRLELVVESGDPAVVGDSGIFLYLALDTNPYELMERGAGDVSQQLRIRDWHEPTTDLPTGLGWCTWDAFYSEVSHEKVREGLQSFEDGGIMPAYVILDDGWQSVKTLPSGEKRLTAFAANEKFPGDLAPTVKMAKEEFGVEKFLVWHALHGYWGGVDGKSLSGYDVRSLERKFSEGIQHHVPTIADWWGRAQGVVPPNESYRFFNDYHRHLRAQGVDGVKVDNQAALEGTAHSFGVGRVQMMQTYHEALEGSVSVHFGRNLINCMSCASEMFYSMSRRDLVRTSTDFWPNRPESHGLHLYTNAQVSLWFGQFCRPDWDMFQSGHAAGTFHAVGRVVGGSPIYVSDKPGQQNFDLLGKLVDSEGNVPSLWEHGLLTRDCLFHDPTREDILLKIFLALEATGTLLGVFNARYDSDAPESYKVRGHIRPSDADRYNNRESLDIRYVVHAHFADELRVMSYHDEWEIELPSLGCEMFTISAFSNKRKFPCVPIGNTEKFTGVYAVDGPFPSELGENFIEIYSSFAPRCLIWCLNPPKGVQVNAEDALWTYEEATGRLNITEMPPRYNEIIVEF